MRTLAWIVSSLALLVFLGACGSTLPTFAPAADAGGHLTAGVAGTINGQSIVLEQALITAQHRVLGLALFDRTTDPDMAHLAPGTWYLGVRFAYEQPGPDLTAQLVSYDRGLAASRACVRLIHVDASGARHDVPVTEGRLRITDWQERGGRIVEMTGSIDLETPGGGHLGGTFLAPVRGWYLAP